MLYRKSAIAQLGARISKENGMFYFFFLCGRSVRGCAIFVFRILFYILYCYIYLYFIFWLFKHKLHFCDFVFYNDFIRFHRISLRTI